MVTDTGNHRLQVFDVGGTFVRTIGAPSPSALKTDLPKSSSEASERNADGTFFRPLGVAVDLQNRIYVCDCGNDRVQIFTMEGRHLRSSENVVRRPTGICVDCYGNAIVCTADGVTVFSGCTGVPRARNKSVPDLVAIAELGESEEE